MNEVWICEKCGESSTGDVCPKCGTNAPLKGPEGPSAGSIGQIYFGPSTSGCKNLALSWKSLGCSCAILAVVLAILYGLFLSLYDLFSEFPT